MGGTARPRLPVSLRYEWVAEERPGALWTSSFERTWPAYRRWFLKEGEDRRPDLRTSRERLEQHMPELLPVWERLVELVESTGKPEHAARMLTLYRPTPYITGCSQAVWSRGEPMLVRNYDYHPAAFEGTFLLSRWSGTRTLATSDCLWGVLDGVNEHGLVVSLAFGGRREVGDGFGIPLILRYVLETCRTVPEACDVLERVPSHMSYNVSLLDRSGERAVAAVAPDRSTRIEREDIATNHQRGRKWTKYDRFARSAERERVLETMLSSPALDAEGFVERFLRPPLYNTRYDRAFGTLYTAAYRPVSGTVRYAWPGEAVEQSLDAFRPTELRLEL